MLLWFLCRADKEQRSERSFRYTVSLESVQAFIFFAQFIVLIWLLMAHLQIKKYVFINSNSLK